MSLTLYPAIDLRGGRCVRLIQGDYQQETVYSHDPVEIANRWQHAGAHWLHVVDLDAAKTGELVNLSVIESIVRQTDLLVQVGGGIRNRKRVEQLLGLGISRVIIGSAAIEDPEFVTEILHDYPNQVVIGIDARDGKVATHGWLQLSDTTAEELAKRMAQLGAKTIIYTDISRDGMMQGVNADGVRRLAEVSGIQVIASGGVSSLRDLKDLIPAESQGVEGAIIGKALYTGKIQLEEALQLVQSKGGF